MDADEAFPLYRWIMGNGSVSKVVLAGSATPYLTLDEIVSLSSDPEVTRAALDFNSFRLALGDAQGSEQLREALANTFDRNLSQITKDNVIVTNSTTGANHLLYRALLKSDDEIIVQYPTYGPLYEEPVDIGCKLKFWRLRLKENWTLDLAELKRLIKPGVTKMLILNNPSNPTGTYLSTDIQRKIVKIAKEHDIIIHCDEIFRPFFYDADTSSITSIDGAKSNGSTKTTNGDDTKAEIPTSLIEHANTVQYNKVIVTGSLSKVYGLSGVRIGWVVTRDAELLKRLMRYRQFSIQSTSLIDEHIGAEALSSRCRPGIIRKHLDMAHTNLALIQQFIDDHSDQCEWVRPTAGACAFIKFKDANTGKAVDDVTWAQKLVQEKGVLISPAGMCFSFDESSGHNGELWRKEFEGRFRVHFTTKTETVKQALKLIGEFLDEEKARVGIEQM